MRQSRKRSNQSQDSRFPTGDLSLTEAERLLIEATARGEPCDLLDHFSDDEAARVIRSTVFQQLCLQQNGWTVTQKGIELRGAVFRERLDLSQHRMDFGLEFLMCRFESDIDLDSARLRYLYFFAGEIVGALNAMHIEVDQTVGIMSAADQNQLVGNLPSFSGDFVAHGAVNFAGAKIGGQFVCAGSKFKARGNLCLYAQGMKVGRDLFLGNGFEAAGAVDLSASKVGGSLICVRTHFKAANDSGLIASGISVEQHVQLQQGVWAEGAIDFIAAKIGGMFDCGGEIRARRLNLRYARIEGPLRFHPSGDIEELEWIDLRDAYAHEWDDRWAVGVRRYRWNGLQQRLFEWNRRWAEPPNERARKYLLSGFTYTATGEHLGQTAQEDPLAIVHWLYHANNQQYDPQSYDQMARVLLDQGYEDAFREVIIAMRIERRRKGNLSAWMSFFDWLLLDVPVRYGYRPWRAIAWGAIICMVAAWFFWLGFTAGAVAPAEGDVLVKANEKKEAHLDLLSPEERLEAAQLPLTHFLPEGYPRFVPLTYAIDLFLPVIDLGQERFWVPHAGHEVGLWLWVLKWGVVVSGWYLTTLFISSFTGLLRVR